MSRSLVRLVCWDQELARERARILQKAGFQVDASPFPTHRLIGRIRDSAPAAILIDLDRLPSHGRAVALLLRSAKSTCHIPLVFAGGVKEKVDRVRRDLPDALFTDWAGIARSLQKALQNRSVQRVRPKPLMERYAGSPLVKKLGFKPKMQVLLLAAPDGFEEQLEELPDGVEFHTKMNRQTQMVIWFVRSHQELASEIDFFSARLPEGASVWIVYPKQTSRFRVDFTQFDVRALALRAGLVDYKICAVDADWTGLKFARKRS